MHYYLKGLTHLLALHPVIIFYPVLTPDDFTELTRSSAMGSKCYHAEPCSIAGLGGQPAVSTPLMCMTLTWKNKIIGFFE